MTSTNVDDANFGLLFYEDIRRRGLLHILTGRFDYAGIQRLKKATREETVKMFIGSEYETLKAIQQLPVEEIGNRLELREALRSQAAPTFFFM